MYVVYDTYKDVNGKMHVEKAQFEDLLYACRYVEDCMEQGSINVSIQRLRYDE
jgi:hypothetical protein